MRGREGGGKKREMGQAEGGRERIRTSEIFKTKTQNLKDLVTAMSLPAKAHQPENVPQEVLRETCAVRN